jgi:hypothetical protein
MADPAVDLRDPVFFRWHAYIDDMFQEFKATLPRYTVAQVIFLSIKSHLKLTQFPFSS